MDTKIEVPPKVVAHPPWQDQPTRGDRYQSWRPVGRQLSTHNSFVLL